MYISIPAIFYVPVYYDTSFKNKLSNRKDLVIGVSLPTQREYKWVSEKETMENYAKGKGVTLKIENADTDVVKQASQVDNLISQGIDILILAPTDSVAAVSMIENAHKAGIKVIAYDRFIDTNDWYVSFDNLKVGEFQGLYLTKRVPKGNYIIMSGDLRDPNSKLYREGAMQYIQPLADKGDIKIVADKEVVNWNLNNALNIVKDSLTANNNRIDAILAPNDATAGAAIEVLKTQGLAGKIPVTGQDAEVDAVQRIIQGTQAMTVFKDTRQLARVAIDSAIKLANQEVLEVNDMVVDVSSILLTPITVDKTNLDKVLIDSGYYTKEEIYKK